MTAQNAQMFDDWTFEKKADAFIAFWGRSPLVDAVTVESVFSKKHTLYIPKRLRLEIAEQMRMVDDAVRAGICERKPFLQMTEEGWRLACRMAS